MRLDATLAALEVPTLFVWGANDQLAPPQLARNLAARMSNARVSVIDDAGHIPHLDQPTAVADAINGFPHA
jgi:pimeloyl-ACP methyl ester carboxylesterase